MLIKIASRCLQKNGGGDRRTEEEEIKEGGSKWNKRNGVRVKARLEELRRRWKKEANGMKEQLNVEDKVKWKIEVLLLCFQRWRRSGQGLMTGGSFGGSSSSLQLPDWMKCSGNLCVASLENNLPFTP